MTAPAKRLLGNAAVWAGLTAWAVLCTTVFGIDAAGWIIPCAAGAVICVVAAFAVEYGAGRRP